MFPTSAQDLAVFTLFNQDWRSPVLDVLLPLFSLRAPLFVLLCALLVWRCMLRGKGQTLYFVLMILAMGASDLATNQVKHAVGRVRPLDSVASTWYQESGQWLQLPADFVQEKERGNGFPSAHAANTAALALMAALLWKPLRRGIWALPVIVGWSRLYLGKHFPTDILGGWILGLVVASLCWLLWRSIAKGMGLRLRPEG
jgi:undecaprenyl-diphosphatase